MKAFINSKSFTILEAMIAIFIITVGIVGVLQMFPLSIQTAAMAKMATVASQLGQEKIEGIISNSYDSISVGTTTEDYGIISGFQAYKRVTVISCVNPNFQEVACNYDLTNDLNPTKKVTITIFWKSPLGVTEKNFKMATLISKR